MRLQVRHQTEYHYSRPIAYAIQTLRLTPRRHDGLKVIRWRVRGESRHELPSFTDGYGNIVHCHTVNHPHRSASVFVEGEIETVATEGILRGVPEPLPPLFFLRATPLTAPHPTIGDLAAAHATGRNPLERLMSLMEAVRARLEHRAGVTHPETTAAQALAKGAGACQDHAHLFIAAARAIGFPARYVAGYLWTGVRGREYEASHAWAEVYLAELGWVGFDPANRTRPTDAYIPTGVGLDYWSAAPIRGARRGEASETLAMKVEVTQADAQQ